MGIPITSKTTVVICEKRSGMNGLNEVIFNVNDNYKSIKITKKIQRKVNRLQR